MSEDNESLSRSNAQESSHKNNRRLQVSDYNQRVFELVVENVEDYAVFAVDLDGTIASWNPGVEKLLGYPESEFVGQPAAVIFTPEDRRVKADEYELNTALEIGRCEDVRWHLRRDNTRFWANGLMMLLRDEAGEVRGFVKIMRDDTKNKQAAEERERLLQAEQAARASAEAATRAKDEFLAMVSHELRSPLNSIKGWNNLLRQQPTPEMIEKVTTIIERQCNQQTELIEDLLDTAQMLSGKLSLDVETVDLTKIIHSAVDSIRPVANGKNVILNVALDSGGGASAAHITGDAERLRQVILNLLTNAVKFTPAGGQVGVELKTEAATAVIVVKDTGIGIAPNFLPRVFERYQQAGTLARRRGGGLGLGLSLVQQIVELHGGTVKAESAGEGMGATFTIRLPAEPSRSFQEPKQ